MKLPEFWKTGAALLVLAGLGSYIWFVERKREPKPEGEREKVTVLAVDKAKAKEISLATAAGDTIRLVKEGSGWKVTAPFAAPADMTAVESMLTSLEKLEADEVVVEQAASLSEYGLDKPSRTVTAVVEGASAPLSVQFGAKSPDGSSVYARTGSAPKVYLVPSWIEGSFDKKPFDLRDRDLLHVKRDDVRSLEVVGPEGSYSLARTDAGEWAFTKPVATRAGRWSVDGLLGTIENLRMESVAADAATDAKPFGLEKPVRSVTLVLKDGATRTLEIGAGAPDPTASPAPSPSPAKKGEKPAPPKPTKYYARQKGTGLVAVVPATLADDLAKGMGELRAKRLLEVATYETEGFEAVAGGAKKAYAKSTSQGQGRPRQDAVEAHRPRREGPRDHEGRGRALQDGRGRGGRVRGPAAGARRLRARRPRPQGDGEGQGRELDRGGEEGRGRLRPPQRRRGRPQARPGEGRRTAEGLLRAVATADPAGRQRP